MSYINHWHRVFEKCQWHSLLSWSWGLAEETTSFQCLIRSYDQPQTLWQSVLQLWLRQNFTSRQDQCTRGLFLFFQRADRMLIPLGTRSWMPPQSKCWVNGGDKILSVLSRLPRNVGEVLSDPYVLFHMAQLSGLLRSHPNQCVSLELAVHAACGG